MCSRSSIRSGQACLWTSVAFGAVAFAAVMVAVFIPIHYHNQMKNNVKERTVMDGFHSKALHHWLHPIDQRYLDVRLFNITNPEDILTGAKPNVTVIGPLRYEIRRNRTVVTWSPSRSSVSYMDHVTYHAVGNTADLESQTIVSINMPFQLISGRDEDILYLIIHDPRFDSDYERLFVERSVKDVLWGYQDPMFSILHNLSSSFPANYSGLRVNGTGEGALAEGHSRIMTGVNLEQLSREVMAWDGMASLNCCLFGSCGPQDRGGFRAPAWATEEANHFAGTFGEQWPPGVEDAHYLPMFVPELFRTVDLELADGHVQSRGVTMRRFELSNASFANSPANAAYYGFGPNGLANISNCQSHARMFASKPLFFAGAPELRANITNLPSIDADMAETFYDVEPYTGTTMRFHRRLQLNTRIEKTKAVLTDKFFFPDVRTSYVPLVWFDEYSELSQAAAQDIKQDVYTPLRNEKISRWTGIAVAIGAFLVGTALFYVAVRRKHAYTLGMARSGYIQIDTATTPLNHVAAQPAPDYASP